MTALIPGNISVVVQGPIYGTPADPAARRFTLACLESVRRHLPGAEIVLSTWKGSDVGGLPFDHLVESDDPGAVPCDDGSLAVPLLYNANRQIISTREGLRTATRPYAMKLRSDMMLTGTGFLRRFGRYPARSPSWRIVRERVLTPTFFCANPRSTRQYPFHASDWWHFGWRDDVLDIWDIPLAGPEIPRWYETRPQPPNEAAPYLICRYFIEQYVWVSFLRKHGPVPFEHKTDCQPAAIELSELSYANNLQFEDLGGLGLRFLKSKIPFRVWEDLYTHGDWERLYQRYCDPAFRPAMDRRRMMQRAHSVYRRGWQVLGSPSSAGWAGALTSAWRARSPGSFHTARRVYMAGVTALGRVVRP